MKQKFILMAWLFIAICATTQSQNECLNEFEYLVKKIRDDYPGYKDKVTDKTQSSLKLLETKIRERINLYPDSCAYYLGEYAAFFKDNHLRVFLNRSSAQAARPEIMEVSSYGKNIAIDTHIIQHTTSSKREIEGIWSGYRDEFAIIRDGDKLVASVIKQGGWKPGQIIYEINPINDTVFEFINHTLVKGGKPRAKKASLHLNGKIIEIHGETHFVRKSDSEVLDKATLYSYAPEHPNGSNVYYVAMPLTDSTYYIRIPDFGNDMGNELVQKHWNEIMSRPNLIIDIRTNRGGQNTYYEELAKIIYSKPYTSKGVEWYASEGNIKFWEDAIQEGKIKNGEDGMKWSKDLLEAMKKNAGRFITHPHYANLSEIESRDTIYPMPRHIGIIMSEDNASSAEQFLLTAKGSDKVILFGNHNTLGILDYSNAIEVPFPSGKYRLQYPLTRSKRLPQDPIDNIGIAPDVIIPFASTLQLFNRLDNWVYFVEAYLRILK